MGAIVKRRHKPAASLPEGVPVAFEGEGGWEYLTNQREPNKWTREIDDENITDYTDDHGFRLAQGLAAQDDDYDYDVDYF